MDIKIPQLDYPIACWTLRLL